MRTPVNSQSQSSDPCLTTGPQDLLCQHGLKFTELITMEDYLGFKQPSHIVSLIREDETGWWRENNSIIEDILCAIPIFCRIMWKFDDFRLYRMFYKEFGFVWSRPKLFP